jgi:hypothetical protein
MRLFRFIQANYPTFCSNEKNASAALFGLVPPEYFDFSPGNITALTGT